MTNSENAPTGETMLVVQAAGGDAQAFDDLHRTHGPRAWRLAVALTGDRADAAAVVPEAVAATFTGIRAGHLSPEADYGTALLAAVRHAALDQLRRRSSEADRHAPSTHGELLGRAFGELPERWRTVLWLAVVEDVAPGAVAPIVELAPGDTAQLAGRARRGLHEQFLQAHLAQTGDRNCARAVARLGDHADGTLDGSDREKLDRHLALCDACAERRDQLDDLAGRLALLAPAMPDSVGRDSSAAWTAAVTPTKTRTATGLSATTEKILAGVSAVAAAAGVVGAAMLGGSTGDGTAQAAPVSPAATERDTPRPLELDPAVEVPSLGGVSDLPNGSTTRGASRSGASTPVVGTSNPTTPTPAGDLGTAAPSTTVPVEPKASTPEPSENATPPAEQPPVSGGTTIADQPVAVEVGPEPGITVGPISVGSEPQPEEGEPVIELGGPLAPIGDAVGQIDEQLGLGLGG